MLSTEEFTTIETLVHLHLLEGSLEGRIVKELGTQDHSLVDIVDLSLVDPNLVDTVEYNPVDLSLVDTAVHNLVDTVEHNLVDPSLVDTV